MALFALSFGLVVSAAAQPPATPTRTAVIEAMGTIQGTIARCVREHGAGHGRFYIVFDFRADGSVADAELEPKYAQTPFGLCVQNAAMSVRLPAFGHASFRVRFPFRH